MIANLLYNVDIVLYTCHYSVVSLSFFITAHLKVKDYGMGMYSFISNNYKGYCLRIQTTGTQIHTFNTGGEISIEQRTLKEKVRFVRDI